jgi:hypothetical protein
MSLPVDAALAGGGAHDDADVLAGAAVHPQCLGGRHDLDAFITENPLHLIRDVRILTAAHEPGPVLDDRHAAAEAAVSLGELEADIAATEHDQMCRHIVELESFDMGERPRRFQAGNIRNGGVRSDVEENLLAREHARPAVVEAHLERFRRHKTP